MNISTLRNILKDRFVIYQVCLKPLVRCPQVKNRKLLYCISMRHLPRAQGTLIDNTHTAQVCSPRCHLTKGTEVTTAIPPDYGAA